MKYKCLVFDHDDTVVNSTATIHYPCFQLFLDERYPGRRCSLEHYFIANFSPGFLEMCRGEYGMDEDAIRDETAYWLNYVETHVPTAYPGIREIMERQRAEGGLIVYGWERPEEERKPYPFPLEDLMRRYALRPEEMLVIDDLKPGYDMARAASVPFAAVGWANDIPQIESFMRQNCKRYFKTVEELDAFLR